jgi:hypothetical protein
MHAQGDLNLEKGAIAPVSAHGTREPRWSGLFPYDRNLLSGNVGLDARRVGVFCYFVSFKCPRCGELYFQGARDLPLVASIPKIQPVHDQMPQLVAQIESKFKLTHYRILVLDGWTLARRFCYKAAR